MTRFGLVLLSAVSAAPAQAEKFSIKCIWNPAPTITFDEESRRVIWETPYAPSHKGIVDFETEDEIRFHIIVGPSRGDRIWNLEDGNSRSGQVARTTRNMKITASSPELRPVMSIYDEMLPY